jgi:hypothetical protein
LSAPDENRDLELIEAALTEGRAAATDPRERELQELALALREDAPEPRPEFARELDGRVAGDFGRSPRRRLRLPALRVGMPALAVAATILLVVIAGAGLLASGGDDDEPATSAVSTEPQEAGLTDRPAVPSAGAVTLSNGRVVERSAQMTIAALADDLQKAADGVGRAAESHGGYVVNSNMSTGGESRRGGSFTLRVPTKQLETTLADISRLGDVRSRAESSQDMTAPYRGTQKRLGNALLERSTVRDKLRDAVPGSDEEEQLRSRLRALNAEVADLSSRMDSLKRRTVFSTVTVTLEEKEQENGGGAGGTGPGDALDDALGTLSGALYLLIRLLGIALPVAVVAGLGWLGAGILRRRRREATLF